MEVSATTSIRPDIFVYTDAKLFLSDMFAHLKSLKPTLSHRLINRSAGATSSGWFSDILKGRISLTERYVAPLCKALHLTTEETAFFHPLLEFSQCSDPQSRPQLLERLITLRSAVTPADIVPAQQFEYYRKWFIPVIRELLLTSSCKDDPEHIAKRLYQTISPREVREALNVLENCGYITADADGFLRPVHVNLRKDPATASVYWYMYMVSLLNQAISTLSRCPKNERDFSAVTIGLSESAFVKATEITRRYRKELLALAESDGKDEKRIYQCAVQIFPVTQ